jgi:hypothetical protein
MMTRARATGQGVGSFIISHAGSHGRDVRKMTPGMYALTCRLCSETKVFRKETMCPYRVSDEIFKTGYAKDGEYDAILVVGSPAGSGSRSSQERLRLIIR